MSGAPPMWVAPLVGAGIGLILAAAIIWHAVRKAGKEKAK